MMRVIIFIDGYGNTVRRICHLCHRIDNQSVVLLSIIRGDNIEAIANLKECGQIILIGSLIMLCQIILAELVGQSF